jgi:hypothetical protein
VLATVACHKGTVATDVVRAAPPEAAIDVVEVAAVEDVVDVPSEPAPRRVVVSLTGDLVFHRTVVESFDKHRQQGGIAWTLNWISPLITPREVALGWLDTPLTDAFRPPYVGGPPPLGAPRAQAREIARDLGRVGIDGMCLATQHAYDQMGDGLAETADTLRAANLGVVGMGAAEGEAWQPWIGEREGIRVAYLCFTQRMLQGQGRNAAHVTVAVSEDGQRAVEAVTAARAQADVVVVGVQWYRAAFRPLQPEQRALARQLIEAGADLVVGSGAVAPGLVERARSPRGDAVIVWSIGTLLSNYGSLWRGIRNQNPPPAGVDRSAWDPASRDVAVLRAQFDVSDPAAMRVVSLSANGLWTQHSPEGTRVLPLRTLTDFDLREARARALSSALGTEVRLRQ